MSRTYKKSILKFNSKRGIHAPHRLLKNIENPRGIHEVYQSGKLSKNNLEKVDERDRCTDRLKKTRKALTKAIRLGNKRTTKNILEREL